MKSARHEKIIELIQQHDIDTQEELAARLKSAGFKVTQATVSRDIRALKLTKVAGKDGKIILLVFSVCGAIGVITVIAAFGDMIGPPHDRLYPVEPVGVAMMIPSAL